MVLARSNEPRCDVQAMVHGSERRTAVKLQSTRGIKKGSRISNNACKSGSYGP